MNIVSRFFTGLGGGIEGMVQGFKNADYSIYKPWEWLHLVGGFGAPNSSGEKITATTAMQISAFYSCVRVISEDMAKIAFHVYKRLDTGGRERAKNHPVEFLLNETANGWQPAYDFREMQQAFLLLRGNAYALKVRSLSVGRNADGKGQIVELVPILPERVTIRKRGDGIPFYEIAPPRNEPGSPRVYEMDDIWHLRGLTLNGYTGVTPIEYQAELLGFSLGQIKYGGRLLGRGARPGGLLKLPQGQKLNDPGRVRLKADWDAAYGGNNSGGTAILEDGMEWQQLGMKNVDMQYMEVMKLNRSQIASIMRVPPHKIGDLEKATFSNIEQQAIEYVTDCLLGWARRWEASALFNLIDVPQFYYPEHKLETLLRGDLKSRYEAYKIGREGGWLNGDQIRELENMNPMKGGELYWRPANMVFSDTPAIIKQQPQQEKALAELLAEALATLAQRGK